MRFLQLLLTGLILTVAATAFAAEFGDNFKAEELLQLCDGEKAKPAECMAFIKGARAGMTAQRLFMSMSFVRDKTTPPPAVGIYLMQEPFCFPKDTADDELKRSVVAFLRKIGPEKRNSSAGFAVLMAFNSQFACK